MLKHSRCSRMGDCFQFLFYHYCDLKNQRWVKTVNFIFQRRQNFWSIETIKTINSLLHYHNLLLSMFHFCYRSIAIAVLISRLIDSLIYSGLLIFCDVAISHNWPQIATFRIIRQKSHNSGKIAKFEERTRKYSLLT